MLEKQIEKKVCDYARAGGLLVYKFTSPGRAAVPDRMMVNRFGHVFFIEFKREKAKPTVAQTREHDRLLARGLDVFVVDDVVKGKLIIDLMVNRNVNSRTTPLVPEESC